MTPTDPKPSEWAVATAERVLEIWRGKYPNHFPLTRPEASALIAASLEEGLAQGRQQERERYKPLIKFLVVLKQWLPYQRALELQYNLSALDYGDPVATLSHGGTEQGEQPSAAAQPRGTGSDK